MNCFSTSKFASKVRSIFAAAIVTVTLLIPAHSASYQLPAEQSLLDAEHILVLASASYAINNGSSELLAPTKTRYTLASVSEYVASPVAPSDEDSLSAPKFSLFGFLTRLHDKIHTIMAFFESKPSQVSKAQTIQQDKPQHQAKSCDTLSF